MPTREVFTPCALDELQIDLDRPHARIPAKLLRLVREHVYTSPPVYTRSKSGNTHVSITLLKPMSQIERLFLQTALGSDPVRELLSWGRVRNGCPYPTLFFEKSVDKPRRGKR